DAAIASAAHPLAFPPLKYQDYQLVDGGVVANVPVGLAIRKGATEAFILNVGDYTSILPDQDNIIQIIYRSISVMMYQPLLLDLKFAQEQPGVKLHYIEMGAFKSGELWDLDKGAEMVEYGRHAAHDYLMNPTGVQGIDFAAAD